MSDQDTTATPSAPVPPQGEATQQDSTFVREGLSRVLASRVPPHNLELERTVLGALILERSAFAQIDEVLVKDCFYDPKNAMIFEAIQQLTLEDSPVDTQTVVEKLKLNGTLRSVGGMGYIATLASIVNSTADLPYHARILYDKMVQRNLISFGNRVIQNSFDEEIGVGDLLQDSEQELFNIAQGINSNEMKTIKELLPNTLQEIRNAAERKDGMSGVNTGFRDLDEITFGWQPTDLVILAARPAMGKTAFALSMALNMAMDYKVPVAFFSLEMGEDQLTKRLISMHTSIPNEDIKRGTLTDEQMHTLFYGLGPMEEAPIIIDDTASISIFDLRSRVRRLVRKYGVRVIFIDYLQLMTASGLKNNANREQEVSTISRSLKQLAKELGITVIALSQLNRELEKRNKEGRRPQLSDLRESGAIEQDADMVIFIHRPEYYGILTDENNRDMRGLAQIIIAKHRNGRVGDVYLRFEGDLIRFSSALDSNINDDYQSTFSSSINGPSVDDPLSGGGFSDDQGGFTM